MDIKRWSMELCSDIKGIRKRAENRLYGAFSRWSRVGHGLDDEDAFQVERVEGLTNVPRGVASQVGRIFLYPERKTDDQGTMHRTALFPLHAIHRVHVQDGKSLK